MQSTDGEIGRRGEAKPLLTGPKRHHYLPQSYLEGFCRDGVVFVYDRHLNEIKGQTPLNTGVVGHMYTLEDSQGRKRYELEDALARLEGKASNLILKLASKESLSSQDRMDLAMFIAVAEFRTPHTVDSLKQFNSNLVRDSIEVAWDKRNAVETLRRNPKAPTSEEELQRDAQEISDYVETGEFEVVTDHKWAITTAITMAENIAPIIERTNWSIVHSPSEKKSFLTSDAPVALTTSAKRANSFYGVGFGNADAVVLFPLTQSCALIASGRGGALNHQITDTDTVRRINLAVADQCQRFVIGRDAPLIRSVVENLRLSHKSWEPKMQRSPSRKRDR